MHIGNDTSSWRPQVRAFLKALSLHRFSSTCTPTTCQYVTKNSFTLTTYVSPFKANTSANWNAVSRQIWRGCHTSVDSGDWRHKLSASKTISSVFHLHISATRELSVYVDGQRLRYESPSATHYLEVTLDRTLSYREHLAKTAGKLKNRNNLLMKLAGST